MDQPYREAPRDPALEQRVAEIIIGALDLEDVSPETLPKDAILFAPVEHGGLGLDSIASLEVISALSNEFDLPFDDVSRDDVASVQALAAYIVKAQGAREPEP